jgi:hypothetical protein
MSGQVLLLADRSEAVIQPGQPSAQMGAWLLDIPDGSTADAEAAAFATTQNFPIGTVARVIDLSANPSIMQEFTLQASWVQNT